jgi:hypothetical protein
MDHEGERLASEGRWREAAQAWQTLGCPYEQAMALLGGDAQDLRQAVTLLDALGAGAAHCPCG